MNKVIAHTSDPPVPASEVWPTGRDFVDDNLARRFGCAIPAKIQPFNHLRPLAVTLLTAFVRLNPPTGPLAVACDRAHDAHMRVNLTTRRSDDYASGIGTIPLSLTIKPSCGLPGDYDYPTDSAALLRLLRRQTDLPDTVLRCFEASLHTRLGGRLLGVELSDGVLTEIGYFID